MSKIRTIVVDDEPLARIRIVKLLEKFDFIQLIGECKNGKEAIKAISDFNPDLVFLDVQMPDINGLDVLKNNKFSPAPFIIFVTAYDQYAIQAFEVKAVDYLLKPYDEERFTEALLHAKEQIVRKENAVIHEKIMNIIHQKEEEKDYTQAYIDLKEKGRTVRVLLKDVYFIEADGNYLRLYEASKLHLLRETMQNFQSQLDSTTFLRIHRSIIINRNFVERISYKGNNQYQFLMKNEKKLLSSRGYRSETVAFLNEFEINK